MNIIADRSQEGGLSTVGYDDDGAYVPPGMEFPIIQNGVFMNYQSAIGQAQLIGQKASNGCAFADSWSAFPIQRMPNVSLQPGSHKKCSLHDLFADVRKQGIYVVGNGSWSIDQQRHDFQFGGQLFYEIKNGKLEPHAEGCRLPGAARWSFGIQWTVSVTKAPIFSVARQIAARVSMSKRPRFHMARFPHASGK